ncbi:hypothetical protein [Teichococcus oryzae]|uniref:Uncharacterized protein n=1 Tax=Teichococcus oryzae TaxID=1608942 RepID=A0A5B2T9G5_9PROT|nr:hypothetical protein [Pseudoroseomonas oryzae]KAA2211261.1 hypothetical protein F0Q34_21065 [Pseudoroseomonas oryzae]
MPSLDNRFLLAAVVDRIIYGQEDTFRHEDAAELLRQMPAPNPWRQLRLPFEFRVEGSMSGSRMSGSAAGLGDVSVQGDGRSFAYDSQAGHTVRVGQWKLRHSASFWEALRGHATIEIVQTLGEAGQDGRSAALVYQRGEPVELRSFRQQEKFIGKYAIINSRAVPWKTPVHRQPIEADYEVETPQGKDGGVFRAAAA